MLSGGARIFFLSNFPEGKSCHVCKYVYVCLFMGI